MFGGVYGFNAYAKVIYYMLVPLIYMIGKIYETPGAPFTDMD